MTWRKPFKKKELKDVLQKKTKNIKEKLPPNFGLMDQLESATTTVVAVIAIVQIIGE
jgi:hypothetical protein